MPRNVAVKKTVSSFICLWEFMLPMISPISDHLKASLGASNYVGKVQQSQSFP